MRAWAYARIGLVALFALASVPVVLLRDLTLGLDFEGGLVLTYDAQIPAGADEDAAMDQAVEVVRRRLDALEIPDATCMRRGTSVVIEVTGGEQSIGLLRSVAPRQGRLRFLRVDESTPIAAVPVPEGILRSNAGVYPRRTREALLSLLPSLPAPAGRGVLFGRTELGSYQTYVVDPDGLEGHVIDSEVVMDEQRGVPQVMIVFDAEGTRRFGELTERWIDQKLAITLDGEVYSAPVIRGRIPGGRAMIDLGGRASAGEMQREAQDLVVILRAGSLPAPLVLSSERMIGAAFTEGERTQGMIAIAIAFAIIAIAALVRYRAAGLSIALGAPLTALMAFVPILAFDAVFTSMTVVGILIACVCMVLASVNVLEWKSKLAWMVSAGVLALALLAALLLFRFGHGPVRGLSFGLIAAIPGAATTSLFGATAAASLRRR